jgi:hypothetical protein
VRETTATLLLGEELEVRFFGRSTAAQELVVESYKSARRKVERANGIWIAKVEAGTRSRVALEARLFRPVATAPTRSRGPIDTPPYAVAARHRLAQRSGMWRSDRSHETTVVGEEATDVFVGIEYVRYIDEDLVDIRY